MYNLTKKQQIAIYNQILTEQGGIDFDPKPKTTTKTNTKTTTNTNTTNNKKNDGYSGENKDGFSSEGLSWWRDRGTEAVVALCILAIGWYTPRVGNKLINNKAAELGITRRNAMIHLLKNGGTEFYTRIITGGLNPFKGLAQTVLSLQEKMKSLSTEISVIKTEEEFQQRYGMSKELARDVLDTVVTIPADVIAKRILDEGKAAYLQGTLDLDTFIQNYGYAGQEKNAKLWFPIMKKAFKNESKFLQLSGTVDADLLTTWVDKNSRYLKQYYPEYFGKWRTFAGPSKKELAEQINKLIERTMINEDFLNIANLRSAVGLPARYNFPAYDQWAGITKTSRKKYSLQDYKNQKLAFYALKYASNNSNLP